MGMFDYVRCEYPLPDNAPCEGWQTKDTPNQYLDTYVITQDGHLLDPEGSVLSDFHGDLEFYTCNVCGVGPDGYMTDDDEPYRAWRFTARFTDGRLTRLTGGALTPDPEAKHLTREEWHRQSRLRRQAAPNETSGREEAERE